MNLNDVTNNFKPCNLAQITKELQMKKMLFVSLLAVVAFMLSACSTPGQPGAAPTVQLLTQPAPTPAQIAARVCPVAQAVLVGLQADVALPPDLLAKINYVAPLVTQACNDTSKVQMSDLKSLEAFAFKEVLPIVQKRNPQLGAELVAAQMVVSVIEAQQAAAPVGN
jgi:hypothetical protein